MKIEAKANQVWKNLMTKKRTCMFGSCNEASIKSHVLQKNGILKEISEDNHLIQLMPPDAFKIGETGILQPKRIGINNAYTFMGFCNCHDTEIFKPIESKNELDVNKPYHQALFSYRGLCQELRRKEIALESLREMIMEYPIEVRNIASALEEGNKVGVKNLTFFKDEFEKAFINKDFKNFHFTTVELPKIELCISTGLNVGEVENPENLPYDEWKRNRPFPFPTSFINIFPINNKSYFIAGYHNKYPCKWTEKKLRKFSYSKPKIIKKELSDLIVLRLEFWVMSVKLFKSIPQGMLRKYKNKFSEEILNHSGKMKTKINLFR